MVQEWEVNPSRPNPYVSNDRGRFFSPCSKYRDSWFLRQLRKFPKSDCGLLRKRLLKRKGVNEHLIKSLPQFSFVWGLNLKTSSEFVAYVAVSLLLHLSGARWHQHFQGERSPMLRKLHSLNDGVPFCIKLRSGVNYRPYICPVCWTQVPSNQDFHHGRKRSRSNYGYLLISIRRTGHSVSRGCRYQRERAPIWSTP